MRTANFFPTEADAPEAEEHHETPAWSAFARLVARFRAWQEFRRTRLVLSALDDATLRDIGVDRWNLRSGPHWGNLRHL